MIQRSILHGLRRAVSMPRLLAVLWLVNVLAALPAALLLAEALEGEIGSSLYARSLLRGFDTDWYAEVSAHAEGLVTTFGPTVLGPGPVLDNIEAWWSGRLFAEQLGLVAFGLVYALVWAFLLGGVIDRLASASRQPRERGHFAAAGGRFLSRFVQLAIASGVLYWAIYRLSRWAFGRLEEASRDVTTETTVLAWVLAIVAITVLFLHLVRMTFDYAKIAVVTQGASAPMALRQAVTFVARHPWRALATYSGAALLVLVWMTIYALLAPGAGGASWLGLLGALVIGQVYLVGRLALRVGQLGAELEVWRNSNPR